MAVESGQRAAVVVVPDRQRSRFVRRCRGLVCVIAIGVLGACGGTTFSPYAPTADLVPPLADESAIHLGSPLLHIYATCDANELRAARDPGPDASEWRAVTQVLPAPDSRSRIVWFATERFSDDDALEQEVEVVNSWFAEPCFDEDDGTVLVVERLDVDGLPDDAVSASWPRDDADAISTVLFDDELNLMMTVVWFERPGPVPTDSFVDVVNTAWSTFKADNRP